LNYFCSPLEKRTKKGTSIDIKTEVSKLILFTYN
jgi:hypothetical protein